jgi:tRNA pseudouridine55 synthase
LKTFDFEAGELLLLNKPLGWSSFQLVKKVRYLCKVKKVGHAGTLDPLATGLMLICTGKATKTIEQLMGQDKTYTGCFRLGEASPSYDRETASDQFFPTDDLTEQTIRETVLQFTGAFMQLPPPHSAIKVNGKRLYENARKGLATELRPRPVNIHHFVITKIEMPHVYFEIRCSKGTYIRSIAHDFGKALNNGAVLTELCRTAIGDFKLSDAMQIDAFEQMVRTK